MVELLKLLIVFAAIVVALNKRVDVGATLIAGAVALACGPPAPGPRAGCVERDHQF